MDNGKVSYVNSQEFSQAVLESPMPVVVYFYSEDCPVCMYFTPVFNRIAEIYGDKFKFVRVFRQENRQLAESYNIKRSPTVLFFKNGEEVCSRLNGYISAADLRNSLNTIQEEKCPEAKREKVYCDVLILGAGAAGLSAAIYTARAKLFTVVIDESMPGGQVSTTFHVANYPGTNGVVRGIDLMENMKKQALDFGANIDDMKTVTAIDFEGNEKHIATEDTDYYTKAVVISTGAQPRKLPAEGESEYRGRGVHYCATCDGAMYQDADILVVGGGESAVEEAIFLTRYARHVTVIVRGDRFKAAKSAQDEILKNPNISVIWDTEVKKIIGEKFVTAALIENTKTGESKEIKTDGLFVYIGMEPRTGILKDKIKLNEWGYIPTDEDMKTNVEGVFAAGDVREKKIRQIATAVGDGVVAGVMAEKYINGRQ